MLKKEKVQISKSNYNQETNKAMNHNFISSKINITYMDK